MNRILVESPAGDRCYAAIQTETGFLFHLRKAFLHLYHQHKSEFVQKLKLNLL